MKRIKKQFKDNKLIIKSKVCLNCSTPFRRWHSIKLLCEKCWEKSPEGRAAKKIWDLTYRKTTKYKLSLARSRLKSVKKLLQEVKEGKNE